MIKTVASRLGTRPATCRKYYVHPLVVESYAQGTLFSCVKPGQDRRFDLPSGVAIDNLGNVFESDSWTIRKLTPTGTNWVVTTLAGQ